MGNTLHRWRINTLLSQGTKLFFEDATVAHPEGCATVRTDYIGSYWNINMAMTGSAIFQRYFILPGEISVTGKIAAAA